MAKIHKWLRWGVRWSMVLLSMIGITIVIVEVGAGRGFSETNIEEWVAEFGAAAPIAFIFFFTLTGSLIIPMTMLAIAGATLFGRTTGFLYSFLGSFLAAMVGFSVARTLGRNLVARWMSKSWKRMERLDRRLEEHAFTTALYMRLLYIPNGLINVTCGISSMRMSSYALASFLGILPMVFAVSYVTSSAKEAITTGDWRAALTAETIIAVSLFVACLSVPFLVGVVRRLRVKEMLFSPVEEINGVFEEVDNGEL